MYLGGAVLPTCNQKEDQKSVAMKKKDPVTGAENERRLPGVVDDKKSVEPVVACGRPGTMAFREDAANPVCTGCFFYQKRVARSWDKPVVPLQGAEPGGSVSRSGKRDPAFYGKPPTQNGTYGPRQGTYGAVFSKTHLFEPTPVYRKKAERVAHILGARISDPPGLPELARLTQTNMEYMRVAFKACFGMTVIEYQRSCRLESARYLLMDPGLTLEDIAFRTGYSDASSLSRAFYENYGIRPGKYRRGISCCGSCASIE